MAHINFKDLCNILEDIKTNQNHKHKIKTLQIYYSKLRNIPSVTNLYPIMRLIVPSLERRSYGMKEDGLRRNIIKTLCLSKSSEDCKSLSESRDFPTTAYNVLKKYYSMSKGELNVGEVNAALDEIASGKNNEVLSNLFKKTSPFEQKWIIMIILKQLGLGLGYKKILSLFHSDAVDLFDKTNDLENVCLTLHNKNTHLNEIQISIFNPFSPMLSKRCDVKEFFKAVSDENQLFYVENKFDGERFQLHMKDNQFKYYSRRGYDFTSKFGQTYQTGIFTPLLKTTLNRDNVKSIILDGEMMGYDPIKKQFGSKGMNFDVKNLTDTSYHQPCFCVFDVLMLNDEVLTRKSLNVRKDLLKTIIKPIEGVILISEVKEVCGRQQIIDVLNDSALKKEEGIVFKRPKSLYVTNSRNDGWWKMKLEYFSDVMNDLDVLVMGGFLGKDKKIDKLLIGVAVPSKRGSRPTVFHSIATVHTGLSILEWNEINEYLKNKLNFEKNNKCESFGLIFGKKKPDFWVKPEESCVLEIRTSELIKTKSDSDYKTDYTLRFARVQKLRFDKPYYDCLTTSELENLTTTQLPVEKIFKRRLNLEDLEYELKKTKRIRKPKYIINEEIIIDKTVSNIFNGLEFCVWTGNEKYSKDAVERIIKEHNGSITKIESERTFCILVGNKHERVNYFKGDIDIVKLSWLLSIVEGKKFVDYSPVDVIYASNLSKNRFMEKYDKFGDSYCEEVTINGLKKIVEYMKFNFNKEFFIRPLSNEIENFHKEIQLSSHLNVFKNYTAYFDQYEKINDQNSSLIYNSKVDELEFKFWGGKLSTKLDDGVNFVIVDEFEDSNMNSKRIENIKLVYNGKVVLKRFIKDSIDEYLENME